MLCKVRARQHSAHRMRTPALVLPALQVRLRVPDKSGAWRVVVAAPTGHEAGEECVEVYREHLDPATSRLAYASKHVSGEETARR